jgi:thiol-disulfide isomerase/thioredoxin
MQKLILLVTLLFLGCTQVQPVPVPKKPVSTLTVFSAKWCVYCQQAKPAIDKIEKSGIKVTRFDIDVSPEVAKRYGVTSVPTFFVSRGTDVQRTQDVQVVWKLLMSSIEQLFIERITAGLTTCTLTSCSRWAAERVIMGGQFPGPFRTTKHPWIKELLDSRAPEVWCQKGAQLGVSVAAIIRSFYALDVLKRNVLYVLPTQLIASDFSKARFAGFLELSPYLQSLFQTTNAVGIKNAGANTLYIRGARGKSSLKSIDAAELIFDELDDMDQSKLALGDKRSDGQETGKKSLWGVSTPTIPDFGINAKYQTSSQDHFFFPCPECHQQIELTWPDSVVMVGDHANDPRCKESYLKCTKCNGKLYHKGKQLYLADGQWRPTATNYNPDVRGYHISQLYSYTIEPGKLVSDYFAGQNSEVLASEFFNSRLGLPYVGDGAKVLDSMFVYGDHSIDSPRPKKAYERLITMGVDQGKTGHVIICEWVQRLHIGKDISAAYDCKVLWAGTFSDQEIWIRLGELMKEWQVLYCVIDADPELNAARAFAKKHDGFVAVTRYRPVKATKEIAVSEEDTGCPMLIVDRTNWLDASIGRFKTKRVVLPKGLPDVFKAHMKNVTRTYERNKENKKDKETSSVAVYVNTGPDHYCHALAYAEIALQFAPTGESRMLGKIL